VLAASVYFTITITTPRYRAHAPLPGRHLVGPIDRRFGYKFN